MNQLIVEKIVTEDADGDGVLNPSDAFPLNPQEWIDSDGDGMGDNSDAFPNDPLEWQDSDLDGVGDNYDIHPNDPNRSTNSNPVIVQIESIELDHGEKKQIQIIASDPDGDPVTLTLATHSEIASLLDDTLTLEAIDLIGLYPVIVKATDPFGGFAYMQFYVQVSAGSQGLEISIVTPSGDTEVDAKVTNIPITGTASTTNEAELRVQYRLNASDWELATGASSWEFSASPLISGKNLIEVRAIEDSGATSRVASIIITRPQSSNEDWHTYLGSSGSDRIVGVHRRSDGKILVVGEADSSWGSPIRGHNGAKDIFVAQLSEKGELLWHTFFGGYGDDVPTGLEIAANGDLLVVGSSTEFWGEPSGDSLSTRSALVMRVSSEGELLWRRFMQFDGWSGPQSAHGLAESVDGSIHVIGWVRPRATSGNPSAFVAKLDAEGNVAWTTMIGGAGADYGRDIQVSPEGRVFVTLSSTQGWGSPIRGHTSEYDIGVAELNASGGLVWNTFLGASGNDTPRALELGSDYLLVSGVSNAPFGTPVRGFSGAQDILLARLTLSGQVEWHTYLGGAYADDVSGMEILGGTGELLLIGVSGSGWGLSAGDHVGGDDVVLARLDASGDLKWNAFLGGTGNDSGPALTALPGEGFLIGGASDTSWGSPVNPHASSGLFDDGFVLKRTPEREASAKKSLDFDGDGKTDLVWRHTDSGRNVIWFMDGAARTGAADTLGLNDPDWNLAGFGDFDGDGRADLLWRNAGNGRNVMWFMDGATRTGSGDTVGLGDPTWELAALEDFDGDGKTDLLWRNSVNGRNVIWFMDGATRTSAGDTLGLNHPHWNLAGFGDFNGDGKTDFLWRNTDNGRNVIWLMDGLIRIGSGDTVGLNNPAWELTGLEDFDGDGKTDLLWRNTQNGRHVMWFMDGATRTGSGDTVGLNNPDWSLTGFGDYNGDGRSDFLWHNEVNGRNVMWFMDGTTRIGAGDTVTLPFDPWYPRLE